MKREAELKAAAMAELRRRRPHYLVVLAATAGCADRGIVGDGRTTWWEFKHGTPDFDSPSNQELFCARLAIQGYCRYVVWQENANGVGARTLIVHPREMLRRGGGHGVLAEASRVGYDPKWLVDRMLEAHERLARSRFSAP